MATDLDACLLDEASFRHDAAKEALARLKREGVLLVLASSKTRSEMEPLVAELGFGAPFVVENGGAIVIPQGRPDLPETGTGRYGDSIVHVLGVERARLVIELDEIARESGVKVRGMASMSPDDVRRVTGLPGIEATKAQQREYDEPFLVLEDVDLETLRRAAERRGLRIVRGGRLHHLTGPTDKGRALSTLLDLYRQGGRSYTVVALGDSPNDLSMLQAADRPVVIPRPTGEADPELCRALPRAEQAPLPGPAGWNRAILTILDGGRLSRVGAATMGGVGE